MADIDLFVCVTAETAEYAELTKRISSKLLSNKHNINWKYVISGYAKSIPKGYEYVSKVEGTKKLPPSYNHGVALNEVFKLAKGKYVIMLDTDFIFLIKNWDDIIVKNLSTGYAAFGADSPSHLNRAHNFPFIYCFCYRRDLLGDIKLDFRPKIAKNRRGNLDVRLDTVKTKRELDVTGIPLGKSFRWETSSRVPFSFYDNDLKSRVVKIILGDSRHVKLPFINSKNKKKYLKSLKISKANSERMAEWHYNGQLFGSHLRLSIRCGLKDKIARYWVKRIMLYLKNEYDL
jgi:glycosyltransferase involved in cell wall biosynthesis